MKADKLRNLQESELNKKLADYRKELFNLRFQHSTAQLENTQRLPNVRKNIARILTVLREREMEAGHEQ
jgi:large subunit ribosomal protein L29